MCSTFHFLPSIFLPTTFIGRAIRLILCNLFYARPGDLDRSTLGHPGKFSYCIAEDEEHPEWLSLAEDRAMPGGTSAVTVMAAGSPRQIMNEWTTEPEAILDTFVAEMKARMRHYSIWLRNYAIIIPLQFRTHFQKAGLYKKDTRKILFE